MRAESVIIMTHLEDSKPKLPHLDALRESNPDLDIHVCIGRESGRSKHQLWKNSDRELRRWWQDNREKVKGQIVLVIEWDTLIEILIPAIPSHIDLAGAKVYHEDTTKRRKGPYRLMDDPLWSPSSWLWFQEAGRLGIGDYPCVGLVSFGFMLVDRWCLDHVASKRWDRAYSRSIQNELRFPSICAYMGARVGKIHLPGVNYNETAPSPEKGIWHGVKEPCPNRQEKLKKVYVSR